MKEWMDFMMNALRGRVSIDLNDLVYWIDSPFIASVTSFPFPPKFRMPQMENYDRSKDPLDHLESFKTLMHLQGVPDEIICRAFPTTLKGFARIWFNRLAHSSPHTSSGDTDIRSPLHAWWTLSSGKTRCWDPTSPTLTKRLFQSIKQTTRYLWLPSWTDYGR